MDRRGWIETSLAAVLSLIMSISGPLLLFFMLPLQILAVRCGKNAFIFSAAGVFFGSIILKLILLPEIVGTGSLMIADSAMFILLLAGLYAVNFMLESFRSVLKLLIITAAAGLCSIPVLYYLNSDQTFYNIMIGQLDSVLVMLRGASSESPDVSGSSIFSSLTAEDLYSIFKIYFLSGFLAVYFFLLTATWRFGRNIGFKSID
ncbi:MAG: hypothetical protein PF518_01305 [Spirochaetaceae bacterium]|jgi:hypothetical protein|nr:hypothetical protein [Spirochaetaceae bacterium]